MIHLYIRSKALFAQLVPVIKEAKRQDTPYRIVDTAFHEGLMDQGVPRLDIRGVHSRNGRHETEVPSTTRGSAR